MLPVPTPPPAEDPRPPLAHPLDQNGRLIWTTPTGHTLTTDPHDHRPDVAGAPDSPREPEAEPEPPPF